MTEVKARLSFLVPGATMLSPQECGKNPKESYDRHIITIDGGTRKNPRKETLKFSTRKSKPAKQAIIICREAYDYMTSKDGIPNDSRLRISKSEWMQMSRKRRFGIHASLIAESLGGKDPYYEILDD